MLEPQALAIIAATLVGWVGAHLFGVGEVVDAILLFAGFVALGFSVFTGARELLAFAKAATGAHTDEDLNRAAKHFSVAVIILGVSTVQAVLLKGQAKAVVRRPGLQVYPRLRLPTPPRDLGALRVERPASLPNGTLGSSSAYGEIEISRAQPLSEQQATLLHELVHRYFSPRTGPLLKLRAELRMSGYERSALLRYLEEGLAEGYIELKTHGLTHALRAFRFPVSRGYVTISEVMAEGYAIGAISLGGASLYVSLSIGPIPEAK